MEIPLPVRGLDPGNKSKQGLFANPGFDQILAAIEIYSVGRKERESLRHRFPTG